jgi:hypothetical protein
MVEFMGFEQTLAPNAVERLLAEAGRGIQL